ncbi:MAG: 16S rRNA (cytidine(1402)-2'-O)-methyltransferase [Steroidobacteraceae bacterium]
MSVADNAESRTPHAVMRGALYVVATPIGNLSDLSPRAQAVLGSVDIIAAEDTRHTGALLKAVGIGARTLVALHEHNEQARAAELVQRLSEGQSVALVSDAGTPLISDPGFDLVRAAAERHIEIVVIPGPCAAIAALSIAGLPTDRFVFEGFLPAKMQARRERLNGLKQEPRTLIFYEAPHRLGEVLQDMSATLGADRRALIARELTKVHESAYRGTLEELIAREKDEANMSRGEIVIIVAGEAVENATPYDVERVLRVLLDELSPAQAAKLTARLTGARRGELYDLALQWADKS